MGVCGGVNLLSFFSLSLFKVSFLHLLCFVFFCPEFMSPLGGALHFHSLISDVCTIDFFVHSMSSLLSFNIALLFFKHTIYFFHFVLYSYSILRSDLDAAV